MIAKTKKLKKIARKKSSGKTNFSRFFFALLAILAITFLAISNWRLGQKRLSLAERFKTLEKETKILEEKNKELEAQISYASRESFLEREARERFNLKKPGEEVVAVVPPEETEEKKNIEVPKSFWQQFLEKLSL